MKYSVGDMVRTSRPVRLPIGGTFSSSEITIGENAFAEVIQADFVAGTYLVRFRIDDRISVVAQVYEGSLWGEDAG